MSARRAPVRLGALAALTCLSLALLALLAPPAGREAPTPARTAPAPVQIVDPDVGGALAGGGVARPARAPAQVERTPAAHLAITLRDPRGAPAVGARARLSTPDGPGPAARADRDGRAELAARGSASLLLELGGERWALRRVPLAPLAAGETRALPPLTLTPAEQLRGTVVDGRGRPVAGVDVALELDPPPPHAPADDPAVVRATSDARGSFALGGLPPGVHRLAVDDRSWRTDPQLVRVPGPALRLALHPARQRSGRVSDERGVPVAGARVATLACPAPPLLAAALGALERDGVTTAADGSFAVADPSVPPDAGWLVAGAAGRAVALVALAPTEADAPLTVTLAPACRVAGQVVDAAGRGVPRALVSLELEGEDAPQQAFLAPRATRADAGGTFALDGLAPGHYTLRAASGRGTAERRIAPAPGDEPLRVAVGGVPSLVVRLTDAEGRAVAGEDVVLRPLGDAALLRAGERERSAVTGDDGRAGFFGLAAGRWEARSAPAGRARVARPLVQDPGSTHATELELTVGPACELTVEVLGGELPLAGCRVELSPAPPSEAAPPEARATDAGGRARWIDLPAGRYAVAVEGDPAGAVTVRAGRGETLRVALAAGAVLHVRVTRHGCGVAGVRVDAAPPDERDELLLARLRHDRSPVTDASGEVAVLRPAPDAPCRLLVRAGPGAPPRAEHVPAGRREPLRVELGDALVCGRVAGEGGRPLAGARVRLVRDEGPGRGMRLMSRPPVEPGDAFGLDREPPPPVVLELGGAEVLTDAAGAFAFHPVPPGPYRLEVGAGGHLPERIDGVGVGDGAHLDLGRVDLVALGRLRGVVEGLTAPAWLRLVDARGAAVAERTADEDGRFAFADLPLGVYRLRVEVGSALRAEVPVEVRPAGGELLRLTLDAPPHPRDARR